MPEPLEERDEIIVIDENREKMIELRSQLKDHFPRCWWLLHHDLTTDIYGLEVCNVWGGKLPEKKENDIRAYIEQFMIDKQS